MDVVERLLHKDEDALRLLMEMYGDRLLRTAYLLLKDVQAAEEAVQDTFIQAFHKIGQLQEPAKLGAWLLRITLNRCRMKQRTRSWRHMLPDLRAERETELAEPGPEDALLLGLQQTQLHEAIGRLDYKYREVITLYYYQELSIADITEQLQANENTIKARLARGRKQLKIILEADQGGWT
ncbi:sigma-70 family RNA polymerase sigma factor [Paenibacillus rhizovicinus]|uniref:Sigma-70 family RNA polymerase sigma factor n=1 Tax=Paenibacillus rhizovicinus TaxID=2704463 RepID=A0A6C0NUG6_9BACL|nr:sigma-70 family RNA polymerase sigma factor [Paenibacillus rhizovicinus]QHW29864.1 sigma-70 family RNA polymerase sigma factor [Paenibacillus rhizovicinus]